MDMGEFGGLAQDQNGCSDPNILIDTATGEILVELRYGLMQNRELINGVAKWI